MPITIPKGLGEQKEAWDREMGERKVALRNESGRGRGLGRGRGKTEGSEASVGRERVKDDGGWDERVERGQAKAEEQARGEERAKGEGQAMRKGRWSNVAEEDERNNELRQLKEEVEDCRASMVRERKVWEVQQEKRREEMKKQMKEMEREGFRSYREGLKEREKCWITDMRRKVVRGEVVVPDPGQALILKAGDKVDCAGVFLPFTRLQMRDS